MWLGLFVYQLHTFTEASTRLESIEILKRIIPKGGIFGSCAEMYINDEKKAHQFVIECFEQCHNQPMVDYLGEDLKQCIVEYGGRTC